MWWLSFEQFPLRKVLEDVPRTVWNDVKYSQIPTVFFSLKKAKSE